MSFRPLNDSLHSEPAEDEAGDRSKPAARGNLQMIMVQRPRAFLGIPTTQSIHDAVALIHLHAQRWGSRSGTLEVALVDLSLHPRRRVQMPS